MATSQPRCGKCKEYIFVIYNQDGTISGRHSDEEGKDHKAQLVVNG